MRQLQPAAVNQWWDNAHPGWAIYPRDSEGFLSNVADPMQAHEQIVAPMPPSSSDNSYPGTAQAISPCCSLLAPGLADLL